MVLQYKGYKNTWMWEEANRIGTTTVCVTTEDREKWEKELKEKELKDLAAVQFWYDKVEEKIKDEAICEEIEWVFGKRTIRDVTNFLVVTLTGDRRQDKNVTYAFDRDECGVYLLNDCGKTVQRLA